MKEMSTAEETSLLLHFSAAFSQNTGGVCRADDIADVQVGRPLWPHGMFRWGVLSGLMATGVIWVCDRWSCWLYSNLVMAVQ